MNKDRIRKILLDNGFTIKEGHDDLKPYVYAAASALLREAACDKMSVGGLTSKCTCGEPAAPGVLHRFDGNPCFVPDKPA